jgi:hypothetical protein
MTMSATAQSAILSSLLKRAEGSGLFGPCRIDAPASMLICEAKDAGDHAEYRVTLPASSADAAFVSLVTPGRYLSQSIEQDLVHTGDKAGELIRDELYDLGAVPSRDSAPVHVEHFRDTQKLYTFRTPVRGDEAALANYLMAYVRTFSHLGDMAAGEDE